MRSVHIFRSSELHSCELVKVAYPSQWFHHLPNESLQHTGHRSTARHRGLLRGQRLQKRAPRRLSRNAKLQRCRYGNVDRRRKTDKCWNFMSCGELLP